MFIQLKKYLNGPNQYLTNSYRLVILTQAIASLRTGMKTHNPLNSAEILSPSKKAVR